MSGRAGEADGSAGRASPEHGRGATLARTPLLIVGVRHRDRAAGRRLLHLLRRERPDRVLVEMSPASLAYRRGPGRAWIRAIEERLERTDPGSARAREARELLGILEMPPELVAARRYVREARGGERPRIILGDRSRHAVPLLEEIDAWAGEVLERLERGIDPAPPPPSLGRPREPSPGERDEMAERDAHAARLLRRTLAAHPGATVVHVCGFEHLDALGRLLSGVPRRRIRLHGEKAGGARP